MTRGEAWYWRMCSRITPGLLNAQYTYFASLKHTLRRGDRWLDIGCGRRIVPAWMKNAAQTERELIGRAGQVTGIDPDADALADNRLEMVKHHGQAERVPEPDASFDLITANMVAEHLDDPASVLAEAHRLLKPGGQLLLHTPNVLYPPTLAAACVPAPILTRLTAWLEKRKPRDIYPTRYRLNRAGTIRRAADRAGFEVVSILLTADSPETVRLGPLVAVELLWIALTRTRALGALRSNLVITLRKPAETNDVFKLAQDSSKPLGTAA